MTHFTRIVSLLTAVAVSAPLSLPLTTTAAAYSEFCVRHFGDYSANVHIEYKRRGAGPNYADQNARAEFSVRPKTTQIARAMISHKYKSGPDESCWTPAAAGNPRPGDAFTVYVSAVLGLNPAHCKYRNEERARDDSGNAWHKIFTWPDHQRGKFVVELDGLSGGPTCKVSWAKHQGKEYAADYMWDQCANGSEGFRRSGCYAWRPRFKGPDIWRDAMNGGGYYYDYTADSGYGQRPIPMDKERPAYFFTEKGLLAHLASAARRGADLNTPGAFGTPLQMATLKNRPDLARVLLGLDPHVAANSPQFKKAEVDAFHGGKTALHVAAEELQPEMAEMLLKEGGAKVNIAGPDGVDSGKIQLPSGPIGSALGVFFGGLNSARVDVPQLLRVAGIPQMAEHARARALRPVETVLLHNDPNNKNAQDEVFRILREAGGDIYADMTPLLLADAMDMNPDIMNFLLRHNLTRAMERGDEERMRALADLLRHSAARNERRFPNWADINQEFEGVPIIVRIFQLNFPQWTEILAGLPGINLEATDSEGRRPLHLAAEHDSAEAIRALLENGADIESEWEEKTPLRVAAENNKTAALTALIELGANLSATDSRVRTALDAAVLNGHYEAERILLDADAPRGSATSERNRAVTQKVEGGGTILHKLAAEGNVERLREALKQQALVNEFNDDKWETALMAAMVANPPRLAEVVRLLLRSGADPHRGSHGSYHSPASLATDRDQAEILEMLLDHGVDPDARNPYRLIPLIGYAVFSNSLDSLRVLIRRGAQVDYPRGIYGGQYGEQVATHQFDLLHHAAHLGHADAIRQLLRAGAEIRQWPANSEVWPAHRAMAYGHDAALAEFMRWPNLPHSITNLANLIHLEPERWPLSFPRVEGLAANHTPTTEFVIRHIEENPDDVYTLGRILRRGKNQTVTPYGQSKPIEFGSPNPNRKRADGTSILHHAAFHSLGAVREMFIPDPDNDWRPNPNIQDANGHPPIYWALGAAEPKNGTRMEIVESLLENGANPNLVNNNGHAALHQAAKWGRLEFFPLLLRYGANPNQLDRNGRSPAELAKTEETRTALLAATVDRRDSGGDTELLRAMGGDFDRMRRLIAAGADVNARDRDGNTPLLRGILTGHFVVDWVHALVGAGAQLHLANEAGDTPLSAAASRGMREIARILVEAGARADYPRRDGWTPLHLAANYGGTQYSAGPEASELADYPGTFRALSATPGLDPDAKAPGGWAALHLAAMNGDAEMMRAVADSGADFNLRRNGWTALDIAAEAESYAVIPVLIENGFYMENNGVDLALRAARAGESELLRAFLEAGVPRSSGYYSPELDAEVGGVLGEFGVLDALMRRGDDHAGRSLLPGRAILHWAARLDERLRHAERLLEWGADVDVLDEDGWTPLGVALESGSGDVALLLIEGGADVSRAVAMPYAGGENGVHHAARLGRMDVFAAVAESASEEALSAVSDAGKTPLEVARESGSAEIVSRLEEQTTDLNGFNEAGDTLLHVAACNNDREAARRWIEAGADPNQFNRNGFSPLHDMVIIREECWSYPHRAGPDLEVVRIMLEGGADPNLRSADDAGADYKVGGFECCGRVVQYQGKTALQMATMSGLVELAEMLLEHGGDPLIRGGKDPENGNAIDNALYPQWYVETFPNSRKVQLGRKLEEEYGGGN